MIKRIRIVAAAVVPFALVALPLLFVNNVTVAARQDTSQDTSQSSDTPKATTNKKPAASTSTKPATGTSRKPAATSTKKSASKAGTTSTAKKSTGSSAKKTAAKKPRSAHSVRMHAAFVASTELRPMAQQLATMRTEVAYTAVTKYARAHTGEAAAAAYLALGHAYLLDRKFSDAAAAFAESRKNGTALSEYAEFLGAEAEHGAGNEQAAERLLNGFKTRYPDSVFLAQAPELEAAVLLAEQKPDAAATVLAANKNFDSRVAFQLALCEVEMAKGEKVAAIRDLKHLILTHPGAHESDEARGKLNELGAEFTVDERRELADAYYSAKKYTDAVEQYRLLAHKTALS